MNYEMKDSGNKPGIPGNRKVRTYKTLGHHFENDPSLKVIHMTK